MSRHNERDSLLILNATSGLGNIRIQKLIEHFGSAQKVLALRERELSEVNLIPHEVVSNLIQFDSDKFLQDEYNLIQKYDARFVTIFEDEYPLKLREIPDAPVVLYQRGKLQKIDDLVLAIVGSRRSSYYGNSIAERFAQKLSQLGFTIVSGLASGIDAFAHHGALSVGGKTVAVLGCGLSHIYPKENAKLYERIAESGVIFSEFPMGMQPLAFNFPRRNRIVSGLSLGVIVVEASLKSGALITAKCALEQGREVFAIPGKIDEPNSEGAHSLIKQGAKLIVNLEDILEEIKQPVRTVLEEIKLEKKNEIYKRNVPNLTSIEKKIFEKISSQPIHVDELIALSETTVADVMTGLLQLEIKQLVKQLPGKQFVLN